MMKASGPHGSNDRLDVLLELLDIERAAEMERNKLELERFPEQVRESLGKTVARLSARGAGGAEGGIPLIEFSREPAGEELSPFHAMNRGDLVSAEAPTGRRMDGTLYEVEEYRALVALGGEAASPLPKGPWSLHLVGSDATYRRMRRALEELRLAEKKPAARLRDVSFGETRPGLEEPGPVSFFNPALNQYQREAVLACLGAMDFALIHGPPGTGKTTVLAEIVRQAALRGRKVLATAPSNIAVDNMLERLLDSGLRIVRLGHPARTLEALRHATLAAQAAAHPDSRRVRDMDRLRERLIRRRERSAGRGRPDRAGAREKQQEIRELWRQARELERSLSREIVQDAHVVLATHGSISKPLLKTPFDLAVLDEASQATEPLSWIPLLQARRAVLAGDPLQLPPTLYSKEAAGRGLSLTLFERLQKELPESLSSLLRVQYRMNEEIMGFPSRQFYGNRLLADATVRSHLACHLPHVRRSAWTERPLVFIDTAGAGFEERWDELLQSRENPEEAALALRLLDELLASGLLPGELAVLTPYLAQAKRLRASCRERKVEIGTVDGFQGREKEAVLISLVRSNDKGELGFLEDARRMNVSLTRARRLLIVIGDSATLARHPLYAGFVDYAQSLGAHRSAWEWIRSS